MTDRLPFIVNVALLVFAFFLGYCVQFSGLKRGIRRCLSSAKVDFFSPVHVAGSVAIAREMAGDSLSTLPNALIFAGALITTMPLSIMGEKFGLRASYVFGTGAGLLGGTLCLLAVYFWSFPLLCFGLLLQGSQQATTQLVRFGVRTVVPTRYLSKSLSWVVAGAAIAAPVGPLITANTVWLIPAHK